MAQSAAYFRHLRLYTAPYTYYSPEYILQHGG